MLDNFKFFRQNYFSLIFVTASTRKFGWYLEMVSLILFDSANYRICYSVIEQHAHLILGWSFLFKDGLGTLRL